MTFNTWIRATLICGALDAAYASVAAVVRGKTVESVWAGVAAGPFGDAAQGWGTGGVVAGMLVHFAIMGVMTAFFLWGVWQNAWVRRNAVLSGAVYGVMLFVFMYYGVLAVRFGLMLTDPAKIAIGLFPHIFFVGIPMALIARSSAKPS